MWVRFMVAEDVLFLEPLLITIAMLFLVFLGFGIKIAIFLVFLGVVGILGFGIGSWFLIGHHHCFLLLLPDLLYQQLRVCSS